MEFTAARLAGRLEQMIGEPLFAIWFSRPDALALEGGHVIVTADSEFELRRIQAKFQPALRRLVREAGRPELGVVFRARSGDEAGLPQRNAEPAVRPMAIDSAVVGGRSRLEKGHPRPGPGPTGQTGRRSEVSAGGSLGRYRLADFAWNADSELLQTAVREVQVAPGRFSPLLITGPNGSGKTHLLEGLVAAFRQAGKNRRAVGIPAEQFTNSFVEGVRGSGLPVFRRSYRDLDLLAIDDVQFLAGKRATLAEFHYTVEHLVRAGKQVVLTADRPVHELSSLMGEHGSRIAGGLVCQLGWPDEASRLKIVQRLARERGVPLDPDVEAFLAAQFGGDARRLSGAMNRIIAACGGGPGSAGLSAVRAAVADLAGLSSQQTTMASIEQTVCECLGVTGSELRSPRRTRRVSSARMLAMWLSRQHTASALSEIGDHFGGRSHSTVVAAQKRVNEMLDREERVEVSGRNCSMREAIRSLERKLRVS